MDQYKRHMFYDNRERLTYQIEGKNAFVVLLPDGHYLVAVDKTKEVVNCSRNEALNMATDLLNKNPHK